MKPQTFQHPEIRDENDNIIKPGAFGKNTPFCTKGNDGILDYIANDLEYLYKKGGSGGGGTISVEVGTTTTTAPGAQAKVTNGGDNSHVVLNFQRDSIAVVQFIGFFLRRRLYRQHFACFRIMKAERCQNSVVLRI